MPRDAWGMIHEIGDGTHSIEVESAAALLEFLERICEKSRIISLQYHHEDGFDYELAPGEYELEGQNISIQLHQLDLPEESIITLHIDDPDNRASPIITLSVEPETCVVTTSLEDPENHIYMAVIVDPHYRSARILYIPHDR